MTSAARARTSWTEGAELGPLGPRFEARERPTEPAMEITSADLEELFALTPTTFLRRMPGRETFVWPGREGRIVKRFVGGESRDRWYERLRGRTPRSPARREAENLVALAHDGIAVPQALGWAEKDSRSGGSGSRSAMVMGTVPHDRDLRACLAQAEPAEVERWLEPLARVVADLHRRGWYHRDLYLQHFVLHAETEELFLLDVGRARRESSPRRRWFVKDLAALLHSTPRAVSTDQRARFLARWLELTGFSGRAADWTRAIQAKAKRLAAHAPRRARPGSGAATRRRRRRDRAP